MIGNTIAAMLGVTPAVTNSYESISTTTLGSSASSVVFSSIPGTYTHLQVRLSTTASAAANYYCQVNGDTGTNYSWHELYGDGASAASGAAATQAQGYFIYCPSTNPTVAIMDFLDYANTNKYKTIRTLAGQDNNGSGRVELTSIGWRNTNAITSITIYPSTGTFSTNGIFALYGIKG